MDDSNKYDFYICDEFFVDKNVVSDRASDYKNLVNKSLFENKIYLCITYWTYPFGGGEEFMYDTMEWANSLGMKCFWIAFCDAKKNPFSQLSVIQHPYGKILQIPGDLSVEVLSDWVYLLRPDVIHHQGHMRGKIYMAIEQHRTEFMTGFHFWTGGIILDSEKKNV